MPRKLSQQFHDRKAARLRGEALAHIAANHGTERVFSYFRNRPTADQFAEMCVAAKLGPGDPLSAAGMPFAVEYIFDEYNRVRADRDAFVNHYANPDWKDDGTPSHVAIHTSQSEAWGNLYFLFLVDECLSPYLDRLDPDDFVDPEGSAVLVDRETGAFGVEFGCETLVATADLAGRFADRPGFEVPLGVRSPFKADDRWTMYTVMVAPLDRLPGYDRERHSVDEHLRHLQSGKVVRIRQHQRRNPLHLRSRRTNADETANVVYRVFDADGLVRYVGEGKEDRPRHVNSGCSHNVRINEHFFLRGPMRVEIVRAGLSKQESLAIERLLLRRHTGPDLWNRKDYEPLGTDA